MDKNYIKGLYICGFLFTLLGIFTLINPVIPFVFIKFAIVIFLVFSLIIKISSQFHDTKYKKINLFAYTLFNTVLLIFFIFSPSWLWGAVPIIFGIWSLFNSILYAVNSYNFKRSNEGEWKQSITFSILHLIIFVIFITNPLSSMFSLGRIIGIYFIIYGITALYDLKHRVNSGNSNRRRVRIVLPIFATAFVPQKILSKINLHIQKWNRERILVDVDEELTGGRLEVLIHISEHTANGFGHCDISFEGKVLSYGTYDSSSDKFFRLFSDGVMAVCSREDYIEYCVNQENKIIVEYGINVSASQIRAIRKQIDDLNKVMYRWYCPYEKNGQNNDDPASKLNRASGAKFFKFKQGKFKVYFALGSNCVKVTDYIIGASGIDSIGSGIITPGTYYAFLDNAYKIGSKMVSYKHVYINHNTKK